MTNSGDYPTSYAASLAAFILLGYCQLRDAEYCFYEMERSFKAISISRLVALVHHVKVADELQKKPDLLHQRTPVLPDLQGAILHILSTPLQR